MWQQRLAELQADIAMSSKMVDGMPYSNTNSVGSPTEDKAIRLADVAKVIEGKIKEIQITISDIELYITSIDDSEMRQIIEYRCAKCMTWEEIGLKLGYERTTVYKKYNSFIETTFTEFTQDME